VNGRTEKVGATGLEPVTSSCDVGDGEYAYWFTWPRKSVPMLNREHVSVQRETPTRCLVPDQQTFEDMKGVTDE
jgi:hypothetical protein